MRLTRVVASIFAVCLVTGLIIYGGIFLRPELVGSTTLDPQHRPAAPRYLYAIGGPDGPQRPNAVAVVEGRIYITDGASGKVFVYSAKGRKISEFGQTGNTQTDLVFPNGIMVNQAGNLVISDSVRNKIAEFSPAGKYLKTLPVRQKMRPGYLSAGPEHQIYVSDLLNNKIIVIDEQGKVIRTIGDPAHPLSYPQGTAIDRQGRLWVADGGNYSIKIYDAKGRMTSELKGGGKPETPFSMVRGIGFDRSGKAYVTDTISHQIRSFDMTGKQLSVISSSEPGQDGLVFPTTVMFGSDGKLFVVDRGAGNVKVFLIK